MAGSKQGYVWGIYEDKIPYLIKDAGEPALIIFEPSRELLKNITLRVDEVIKIYKMILPANCSLCVLGYDPNLPAAHTQEQIATAFATFIKANYRPGILIGISYGGFIALPFAAMYPELVQKLVLLVSAYQPSAAGTTLMRKFMHLIEKEGHYQAAIKFNSLINNTLLRILYSFLTWAKRKTLATGANPATTFINAYRQILKTGDGNKKYLAQIQAPTLVIGGTDDPFFSKELFEETAALIPQGKAVVFANQGHYLPLEKLKAVKKILAEFIVTKGNSCC